MAKQTEIAYEPTKEWQDFQTGGTRIDAVDLNNMENGISNACAAVDQLRTKRLPTYVVAQDGDTATQDVYMEDILGPCLILDLATRTTYYETGGDEDGHRKAITSGADIDKLRDSLSQAPLLTLLHGTVETLAPGSSTTVSGISDHDFVLVMAYADPNGARSSVLMTNTNSNAAIPAGGETQLLNVSGNTVRASSTNTATVYLNRVFGVDLGA